MRRALLISALLLIVSASWLLAALAGGAITGVDARQLLCRSGKGFGIWGFRFAENGKRETGDGEPENGDGGVNRVLSYCFKHNPHD